jgi:hypothetical protein
MGWTTVSFLVGLGPAAAPSTFVVSLKQRDAAESPVRSEAPKMLTKDLARHPVGVRLATIEAEIAGTMEMPNATVVPLVGPMAEEVKDASSGMTDSDLKAIAVFLKKQSGRSDEPSPLPKDNPQMVAGEAIYRDQCAACHQLDGNGVEKLIG